MLTLSSRDNLESNRDMLIDFKQSSHPPSETNINDTDIEMAEQYKYLGIVINNNMKFDANVEAVIKKNHRCLYFFRYRHRCT